MASLSKNIARHAKPNRQKYRRACDICSANVWFNELKYIGQNRWACRDDYNGWTAEQLARHLAGMRPLVVRPRRNARVADVVPEYRGDEARTLRLVLDHGMTKAVVSATGAGATSTFTADRFGACGMYLAEIIEENERPVSWIARAKTGLRTFADGVLGLQYGSPTGPSPSEAANSVLYGGATAFSASAQSLLAAMFGGLCLIRAYRILGDQKYLDGANRCATWLRHVQRRDVWVTSPTTPYLGAFMSALTIAGKLPQSGYTTDGAGALWFLAELRRVVGGDATYGVAAAAGDFSAAAVGTLDTMADDALAFYVGDKIQGWSVYGNNTASGTFGPMSPLSAATPRVQYIYGQAPNPFALQSQGGKWVIQMTLNSPFALGLRGVFEWEGYSARVASVYEWIVGLSADPASAMPANSSPASIAADVRGDFDPELSPPSIVEIEDPVTFARVDRNAYFAGSLNTDYGLSAAALLAPIRVAAGRDHADLKELMVKPARVFPLTAPNAASMVYPYLRGLVGLSGQGTLLMTASEASWASTINAALCGSLFRYAPEGYPDNKAG